MRQKIDINVLPKDFTHERIKQIVSKKLGIPGSSLTYVEIERKSLDARRNPVNFNLRVQAWIDEPYIPKPDYDISTHNVSQSPTIHIAGLGPAGLFAALKCIELGYKPIIFERGKCVRERRRDLAQLTRQGLVNPNSNYCFGEGGAGTFSDGKLYTRSTKRGNIYDIYQQLVHFGADATILTDAQPHIGTNKLPGIIENIRHYILEQGGEIYFNSTLTDLEIKSDKLTGVWINDTDYHSTSCLILATGHSGRDIFRLLMKKGINIQSKPLALGVRVEHPQELIDNIQYHTSSPRHPNLPPAAYKWVKQVQQRGVYSFCMCPGGIICPAATQQHEIVVNGWSPSKRNSRFANSGIVVEVTLDDLPHSLKNHPLAFMHWQEQIEHKANQAGGGHQKAPAQRLTDFLNNKFSSSLPDCSYIPGLTSITLKDVVPPFVYHKLARGFRAVGNTLKGYVTSEAVVVAVESRTSSPIRIPRDKHKLTHPTVQGLIPCGEGAGYAGGIVSAALDGMRCAEASARIIA